MVAIERGLRPDERKQGRGKPPDFTFGQDWADRICNWIANGGTLAAFCQFTTSPSCSTVFRWLRKYPEFMEDYARAREFHLDCLVGEALHIADTLQPGSKIIEKADGTIEVQRFDMVQHRRLRVASRQWAVAVISGRRTGAGRSANREGAIGTAPAVEITPEEQERVAREILMQRGYAFV